MLIGPADIIVKSWKTLRANWRFYAEFVIWFVVLGILQWTASVLLQTAIPEKTVRVLTLALVYIPISLAYTALSLGMVDATAKILKDKKFFFRESLYDGAHKLFHFLWVWFLYLLIMLGGIMLLVIPAIIFFIWYKFFLPYVIVDDVHGVEALKTSRALSRGRWWAVFFRTMLPSLFFYATVRIAFALIYLVVGAVIGQPGLFFGNTTGFDTLPASLQLASAVISQTVNGFSVPLFIAAELLLWFSLKENPGATE